MSTKKERLKAICKIIRSEAVENQEQLMKRLNEEGFIVTQATLSRDIRQLKVAKIHDASGAYLYKLPEQSFLNTPKGTNTPYSNIEFSGNLAIIKTKPGYAMAIASDIDANTPDEIIGTIAGDDTILIIPREGYSRESITKALLHFI